MGFGDQHNTDSILRDRSNFNRDLSGGDIAPFGPRTDIALASGCQQSGLTPQRLHTPGHWTGRGAVERSGNHLQGVMHLNPEDGASRGLDFLICAEFTRRRLMFRVWASGAELLFLFRTGKLPFHAGTPPSVPAFNSTHLRALNLFEVQDTYTLNSRPEGTTLHAAR